ncbi:MAG: hypothetical protein ACRDJ4_06335 [Actinomycetota bacterium]
MPELENPAGRPDRHSGPARSPSLVAAPEPEVRVIFLEDRAVHTCSSLHPGTAILEAGEACLEQPVALLRLDLAQCGRLSPSAIETMAHLVSRSLSRAVAIEVVLPSRSHAPDLPDT